MNGERTVKPIAYIRTNFKEKFGIPRQSGRVKSRGEIVFLPEFRDENALKELDGFNYIWILFDFSLAHREKWSPTVRPPRLGGNRRVGVFASRSPFRPNSIGLSSVRLVGINKTSEGLTLSVEGADLLDGTTVYDIKPYLPSDCHTDATGGYADEAGSHRLTVIIPDEIKSLFSEAELSELCGCLADDPRPSYIDDGREYGMSFCDKNVRFTVESGILNVVSAQPNENK